MSRYHPISIGFHWLLALLLFCMFPLGVYMHELPLSPQKLQYYSWHKWGGVTIFFLVLLRILWRVSHQPPAPVQMPAWQKLASAGVHYGLYALMVVIPLSGWLMSSAHGFQTVWFGVLPLPDLLEKNADLAELLKEAHKILNIALLALFSLHLLAALKHQFIDRDGLMSRMSPFSKQRS